MEEDIRKNRVVENEKKGENKKDSGKSSKEETI